MSWTSLAGACALWFRPASLGAVYTPLRVSAGMAVACEWREKNEHGDLITNSAVGILAGSLCVGISVESGVTHPAAHFLIGGVCMVTGFIVGDEIIDAKCSSI